MESDMTNAAASIRQGLREALTQAKGHKTRARVHHIEVPEPEEPL
jgi:putative transcriptional regulator